MLHTKKTRNTGIFKTQLTNVNTCGKIQPKQKQWLKQDAFEDTVKPLYNGPVYSGHPIYYGHLAITQGWPLYTGLTVNPKVSRRVLEDRIFPSIYGPSAKCKGHKSIEKNGDP